MLRQGIRETSIIPKYPVGMRYAEGDRVFRYGHAGTALRPLIDGMCGNLVSIRGNTDAVQYPAGTNKITIPMNPNSVNYVAEQLADYWKGGYIWIMLSPGAPQVYDWQLYRIKSSEAAVGGFVTLTLEDSLKATVTPSREVNVWPNIYQDIRGVPTPFDGYARMSLVCLPLIPVPLGHYFWGQTWGPMFCQCGYTPGRAENDREIYWRADHYGLVPGSEVDFSAGNAIPQRVGFLITNTHPWTDADGNDQLGSDNFFMLQLAP